MNTKEKMEIFTLVKTLLESLESGMENLETTKEEYWQQLIYNQIVKYVAWSIDAGIAEKPGSLRTFMKQVAHSTVRQLYQLRKELYNISPQVIEEKNILSSMYQGVLVGLINYMWQSKQ